MFPLHLIASIFGTPMRVRTLKLSLSLFLHISLMTILCFSLSPRFFFEQRERTFATAYTLSCKRSGRIFSDLVDVEALDIYFNLTSVSLQPINMKVP